jgi:hypothetical protein
MDYPLSKTDIERAFDGRIKVLLYNELSNYKTIEELLYPYNRVCILYYWKKYHGHWVCIFKNINNRVEIFNSFGGFIDDTLKDISKDFKNETNQNYKHLTDLLYRGGREVEYNDKQLQNDKASTCGRWCVYRMFRNDLTIEEFVNLFKNIKNKDKKIISLTSNI